MIVAYLRNLNKRILWFLLVIFIVSSTGCKDIDLINFLSPELNVKPEPQFIVLPTLNPLRKKFDASSTESNGEKMIKYEWDFGDGFPGEGKITEHAFERPGIYTVMLTATDDDYETGSTRQDVEVNIENESPTAIIISNAQIEYMDHFWEFDGSESYDNDGSVVRWEFQIIREDGELIKSWDGKINFRYHRFKKSHLLEGNRTKFRVELKVWDDKGKSCEQNDSLTITVIRSE